MKLLVAAALLVCVAISFASGRACASASNEELVLSSFSLYDYAGGLWNANVLERVDGSIISAAHESEEAKKSNNGAKRKGGKKKNSKTAAAAAAAVETAEADADAAPASSSSDSNILSSWWPSFLKSGDAGLASGIATAFTPEYTVTCQIDGKPGFLRHATLYGMPTDVSVDIGTGNSQALDCSVNANTAGGQDLALLLPAEHRVDMRLIVVPLARQRASMFLVQRIGSLPRQLKDYVAEAFGDKNKGKGVTTTSSASSSSSSSGAGLESQLVQTIPGESKVGGIHPDSFLVTHRAAAEVDFQNIDPLSGLSASSVEQRDRQANKAKRGAAFAHGTATFEPINKQTAAALAEFENDATSDGSSDCRVQPSRASAVITTKSDLILTVALRYSGNCPQPLRADPSAAAAPQDAEKQAEDDGSTAAANADSTAVTQKQQNTTRGKPQEVFVTLNVKRFAVIGDEEVDMGPDASWYNKRRWGPTIGAIVLLTVIVGGRRGMAWFLKRRGIDVSKFLKSTQGKTKQEILAMRKAKLKNGPMYTDEEISRLQEEEDRAMVADMERQQKENDDVAAAAAAKK